MFDLKGFRQSFGLTQNQIAEILNCGQPNISAMEKSMKDLEPLQKKTLSDKYGEDSVTKFTFQPLNDKKTKHNDMDYSEINNISEYETYLLPMSAMGGSLTGISADVTFWYNCERIISPVKGCDCAIDVSGDSMSPEYPSGSRIYIKKINPNVFIDWGKTYVLDTCNGIVVKEIHKCEKEGYITCHSVNPDPKYADFDVPMSEIYGIYRVLVCVIAK